ncbi:hypothetical protein [Methylophaga sp.]|uniref:hypothetical protein n=1 Tax=Methylophaga sp. TaxID=2024840 RepID=UPI003F698591
MSEHAALFRSVAVMAEFHPQAKALRFWRNEDDCKLESRVELYDSPLEALEELEADIALVSSHLTDAVLPDFYAFCRDIETIFEGGQPSGPITKLDHLDWPRFRRISAYAQYWKDRNPREVSKLLTFVMGIPLYSCLLGELITQRQSDAEQEILNRIERPGGIYILGVNRFKQLFREDIDKAFNEAKMLVSTFRGSRSENAARIVNGMLDSMWAGQ